MGHIYKVGEGAFRAVYKKEQLEKLGYISAKKAFDLILSYLCDGTYKNGGLEKYKKYTNKLSEVLDKVQMGEGKATRNYYKENEVIAFIQSILNGDEEVLIFTQSAEKLKEQGYVSGVVVGNGLFSILKELNAQGYMKCMSLSTWYNLEFKKLRNTVSHKTIGVGKSTSHYYLKTEVNQYLNNLVDSIMSTEK